MRLGYYKLHNDVPDLDFSTREASCFDLPAYMNDRVVTLFNPDNTKKEVEVIDGAIEIFPKERVLVPTGVIFDIHPGWSVRLHARSGLSIKNGIRLANSEGVIDSDYILETFVPIINDSTEIFELRHGDRIAQAELVRSERYQIKEVKGKPQQRGNRQGGFGSTGVNNGQGQGNNPK